MQPLAEIVWTEKGFNCGPYSFIQDFSSNAAAVRAAYPEFVLMKDRANVLAYVSNLSGSPTRDFLELGIMRGGSCGLFESLYKPQNHMALDIYRQGSDGLDELESAVVADGRHFRAHFNLSQTDIPRILSEWKVLSGQPTPEFDVIVDDASHAYELSLASFNGLFPYVRAGGVYVIEDWGWAHWPGPWQEPSHADYKSPALSNLPIHCLISTTGGGGAISQVIMTPNQSFVFRGGIVIKPPFDVRAGIVSRGRIPALL
jgi:hypothetical protein